MKLSIRLQNHGKKNHPLWWIVIAPNRRNIFGKYIQHVGYWSPRQGYYLQRQIVLDIPRIKYWMSCGAVPTQKVQKFLSIWGILPEPWYYKKSQQQLAKIQQKQAAVQLTDKQKRKIQWKQKRKARQQSGLALTPHHYYKQQARLKFMQGYMKKLDDLRRTSEKQNEILRDLLLHNQFGKLAKINQLSGKSTFQDSQQLKQLTQSLKKAKAELGLLKKNAVNSSLIKQSKISKAINDLCSKIRAAEVKRILSISEDLKKLQQDDQPLTEELLQTKLEFQMVHKKIQKNFDELEAFATMNQPVLLQEYADFLVSKKGLQPEIAYAQAQKQFIERGVSGCPITKYELNMWDQLKRDQQDQELSLLPAEIKDADTLTVLKKAIQWGDLILPPRKTVHPVPDLQTYIPQQYYEPITNHEFQTKTDNPLTPYEQLQKYHQKKGKKAKLVI